MELSNKEEKEKERREWEAGLEEEKRKWAARREEERRKCETERQNAQTCGNFLSFKKNKKYFFILKFYNLLSKI